MRLRAEKIIRGIVENLDISERCKEALTGFEYPKGKLICLAVGKAAYQMARSASECLQFSQGFVLTKYGHSKEHFSPFKFFEAGHPISDENTYQATKSILEALSSLTEEDKVLFLLSGGASSLFELPEISKTEWEYINQKLLDSGANINEINAVRKHLSKVKGGKLLETIWPASVEQFIISDVVNGVIEDVGSGPCMRANENNKATDILEKYHITCSEDVRKLLNKPLPTIESANYHIISDVNYLIDITVKLCQNEGYQTVLLTNQLSMEAREAGKCFAQLANFYVGDRPIAFIAAGETVVKVTGKGKGGRNQEMAVSFLHHVKDIDGFTFFSLASDGTDGPTEVAGGIIDPEMISKKAAFHLNIPELLEESDSYHALQKLDGLIITGPTYNNINDVSVLLME